MTKLYVIEWTFLAPKGDEKRIETFVNVADFLGRYLELRVKAWVCDIMPYIARLEKVDMSEVLEPLE